MSHQQNKVIWVVVLVESGVPTLVEAYSDQRKADTREQILRQDINPDYDEVGLFEIVMDESPDQDG